VPAFVLINKIDTASKNNVEEAKKFFSSKPYCSKLFALSALNSAQVKALLKDIVEKLPEGKPFFAEDELTDLSERFFVAELIREQIFALFEDEIPYHTTVIVNEFKQKSSLIKIRAEIIVQRESQKAIIIGEGGKMIKQIGSLARQEVEKFLEQKVFLELFVKVRPKWRENELYLKEYGY